MVLRGATERIEREGERLEVDLNKYSDDCGPRVKNVDV